MVAVAEGVLTSKAAYELSKKLNIECPIIEGIYKVIHRTTPMEFFQQLYSSDSVEGVDPVQMLDDVMTRALKEELDPEILDAITVRR